MSALFCEEPADNKSWSLFGSLSSSTLLPENFPVTDPLNICHLSFKRNTRTTIMLVFFLPKSSVLNLSQSSPWVSMWVICVCYPHANYDSVSHYSQKGCLQVASTKIQFCGEHHQRRFTAALISSMLALSQLSCMHVFIRSPLCYQDTFGSASKLWETAECYL